MEIQTRWGSYKVLEEREGYLVKELRILPDRSISHQYHRGRAEFWNIIEGEAKILCNGNCFTAKAPFQFYVPKEADHKVTNIGLNTLVAIEIWVGEILSEDDIVRI